MSNNKSAFVSFVSALRSRFEKANVELKTSDLTDSGLPENKNWVCLESATNDHKVYVPKSVNRMGVCHTTLPLNNGISGVIIPEKPPGKIVRYLESDLDLPSWDEVIRLMGDSQDRLPANRKPASRKASEQEAPAASPAQAQKWDGVERRQAKAE